MKRISLLSMLLFAAILFHSCQRKAEFTENLPATKTDDNTSLAGQGTTIEALSDQYFKTRKEEAANAQKIISVTNEFFAINGQTKEFKDKKPSRIQPIYAYGINGVAYYEIWFTEDNKTPQGWILISATDKDYPLVNFSQGTPYSSHMLNEFNQENKVYRFGVSYYTMEKNGQRIAEYGKMPSYVANAGARELEGGGTEDSKNPNTGTKRIETEPKEGIDYTVVTNYESLKQLYANNYFTSRRSAVAQEMNRHIFPTTGHGEAARTGTNLKTAGEYQYRWVAGSKAYYTQIQGNSGFNYFSCWSGCSNNAWTSIYGWWDANRGKSNLIPTTSTGEASPLYRNTTARRNIIDPIQMNIRSLSGTYCSDGAGATSVSNVYKGVLYAPSKGYGYYYSYQWCSSAGSNVNLANIVTEGIANNYNPVHVGANSHAYVGLGWAQWTDNTNWTWAYCYPGWREDDNDNVWISWKDMVTATRLDVY